MMTVLKWRRVLMMALGMALALLGALFAGAIRRDAKALYVLGNTAANSGYYDVADRLYRRSIRIDESNCVARLGLAWVLHVRGFSEQAMAELATAERMAVGPVRDLARGTRVVMEADLADGDSDHAQAMPPER